MILPSDVDIKKDSVEKITDALIRVGYERKAARYLAEVLKGEVEPEGPVM